MAKTTPAIYVQYGCGFSVGDGWLNYDSSPTLRIERLPLVGVLLSSALSGNAKRFPAQVRYGDICRGLPLANNSVRGVYASHVLEHLPLDSARLAIANTFRMLEPGGTFRLIVPDLEARAKRYVQEAATRSPDAAHWFMGAAHLGVSKAPIGTFGRLRQVLGGSMHLWMWDEFSLSAELAQAGFQDIRRCSFGDADDPMFLKVEDKGRFFDEGQGILECALEARKPKKS